MCIKDYLRHKRMFVWRAFTVKRKLDEENEHKKKALSLFFMHKLLVQSQQLSLKPLLMHNYRGALPT